MARIFKKKDDGQFTVKQSISADEIIAFARKLVAKRLKKKTISINASTVLQDYLVLHMSDLEVEHFWVLFMDSASRVINHEVMFRGTTSSCSTYPREIIRSALRYNAQRMIVAHNHPSAVSIPSQADIKMTEQLSGLCEKLGMSLEAHLVVGSNLVVQVPKPINDSVKEMLSKRSRNKAQIQEEISCSLRFGKRSQLDLGGDGMEVVEIASISNVFIQPTETFLEVA